MQECGLTGYIPRQKNVRHPSPLNTKSAHNCTVNALYAAHFESPIFRKRRTIPATVCVCANEHNTEQLPIQTPNNKEGDHSHCVCEVGGSEVRVRAGQVIKHYRCISPAAVSAPLGYETMATQYTDLELALNTLVTNFHSASATDGNTLTVQEFQSMLSKELPNMVKSTGEQEGLNKLLKDMGVEEGKGVTFKDFWGLVNSLANAQCGLQSKEKQVKCMKCILI